MKNIIFEIKKEEKRECAMKIPSKLFKHKNQINIINSLYMNPDNVVEYNGILIKELEKKIASYKSQDINKNKYKNDNINTEETLEKLVASKLICYYCNCRVKIFYDIVRDPQQWTLDRIDNELPHQRENVVIACLKCNIERRKIDKDKFLFTKQLKIVKED